MKMEIKKMAKAGQNVKNILTHLERRKNVSKGYSTC
jgi:fatty acid-binding protein DegV